MQCSALQRDFNLTIFNNNTAISNIVCRVANSTFNYNTNCPIAFATTIECNLQQVFSSMLFTLTHYILFVIIIYLNIAQL